jgi:hypothetical protein
MIDEATTNKRLSDLYEVLIGEGYTITLGQHGGFYALREGGYGVPCSMKLWQYLEGAITANDMLKCIVGREAYISRKANEVEDDNADREEDLPETWDQVRAEIAAATSNAV